MPNFMGRPPRGSCPIPLSGSLAVGGCADNCTSLRSVTQFAISERSTRRSLADAQWKSGARGRPWDGPRRHWRRLLLTPGQQHAVAAQRACDELHRDFRVRGMAGRSEEHTSELQSLMRISYAVFCLKKKKKL